MVKRFPVIGIKYSPMIEFRSSLALGLLYRSTSNFIAADDAGEDSAGRQKLRLQTSKELVSKAFAIADEFVDTVESRGDFKEVSVEEIVLEETRLRELSYQGLYKKDKTSTTTTNNNQ